ncbi:MAG: hypothetical protein ABI395_00600 [Sphingobium sp.]
MKAYLYLGAALVSIGMIIGAFFFGISTGVSREKARELAALEKSAADQAKKVETAQSGDLKAAAADVQRETTTREIIREVPKIIQGSTVYRNVCVDADGVRLLQRAVAAANGGVAPTGGPDGEAGNVQQPAGEH